MKKKAIDGQLVGRCVTLPPWELNGLGLYLVVNLHILCVTEGC